MISLFLSITDQRKFNTISNILSFRKNHCVSLYLPLSKTKIVLLEISRLKLSITKKKDHVIPSIDKVTAQPSMLTTSKNSQLKRLPIRILEICTFSLIKPWWSDHQVLFFSSRSMKKMDFGNSMKS